MFKVYLFFKKNLGNIILGSVIIFSLLVIFSLLNINFLEYTDNIFDLNMGKIVTIETLSKDDEIVKANKKKENDEKKHKQETSQDVTFCDKYESDHVSLENICNNFEKNGCGLTRCCHWLENDKEVGGTGTARCVASNDFGPIYLS